MTQDSANSTPPHYSVSIWELMLILFGAIALIGAGLIGLGIKVLNNAFDPMRAEAIAHSLVDYDIPGGSQGIFGINIGSAKLAWVRSNTTPPDVILFVGKTPINKEAGQSERRDVKRDFETPPSDTVTIQFTVTDSKVETKSFCGKPVDVTVETGEQSFGDPGLSLPATRYFASTTEADVERLVILTANGKDAPEKAAAVFRSLQCKK